jgi:parvulin-like peptidyl-prolyl isomerase
MKVFLLAAGSVVGMLVPLTGCGSGDEDVPTNGVAKIGDTVITATAFEHQLDQAARGQSGNGKPIAYTPPDFEACIAAKRRSSGVPEGQKGKSEDDLRKECEQDYRRLRTDAMEQLIQREWVERAAAKRNVDVTPAEARKELETQKAAAFKTEREYKDFLLTSGRSEADLLNEMRVSLLQRKLGKRVTAGKVKVTDPEVQRYYDDNKKTFGKPERRSIRIVVAKNEERAVAAKRALDAGEGWPAVAKKYSIDKDSAAKGGLLTDLSETGDKKVDAELKQARIGTISEPAKTQFGWWVYEVEKVTPASVPPLADVRKQIEATLKQQEQQKLLDDFARDFREEYRGQTVCADDYKVASCGNGPATNPTTPQQTMTQPQSQQSN